MAQGVDFKGTNIVMRAPEGREDVADIRAFKNDQCCVTCWELDLIERAEVARTGRVFLSVFMSGGMPPVFVGGAEEVRGITVDYGGTFPTQEPTGETQAELHNRLAGQIVSQVVGTPIAAGGRVSDVMVLTESVLVGVALACIKLGGDEKVLDLLFEQAKQRLAEARLRDLAPEGRG